MVTEQLSLRKFICGWFRFLWLWLLIAIMKIILHLFMTQEMCAEATSNDTRKICPRPLRDPGHVC